jgi:glycosyltransferase involved in cell wall biosynthesis
MRVIFQNEEDRSVFLDQSWISAEHAVLIRGSGVDVTKFVPSSDREKSSPPIILMASRLLASKGVAEFVEAARLLKSRNLSARFVLLGDRDPDNPETVSAGQLADWAAERCMEVWGRREDVATILRTASVFVLPTYYREGVPKALIEASAAGLPCVTTDTPGCRDIVAHNVTGLLVPARDSRALADAIAALLVDDGMRQRMGAAARERVLAHFSLDEVVRRTLAVYDELLT